LSNPNTPAKGLNKIGVSDVQGVPEYHKPQSARRPDGIPVRSEGKELLLSGYPIRPRTTKEKKRGVSRLNC